MDGENNYLVTKVPDDVNDEFSLKKNEEKIICDVCGYANEKFAFMCKKCSNYLENEGERK